MSDESYGLTAKLSVPYDQAMERVPAALKSEGFGLKQQPIPGEKNHDA